MVEALKWVLLASLLLVGGYIIIRVFSKALFKSYFETKKEQLTREEK